MRRDTFETLIAHDNCPSVIGVREITCSHMTCWLGRKYMYEVEEGQLWMSPKSARLGLPRKRRGPSSRLGAAGRSKKITACCSHIRRPTHVLPNHNITLPSPRNHNGLETRDQSAAPSRATSSTHPTANLHRGSQRCCSSGMATRCSSHCAAITGHEDCGLCW